MVQKFLLKISFLAFGMAGLLFLFNNCSPSGVLEGSGSAPSVADEEIPLPPPPPQEPIPPTVPTITTEFVSNFLTGTLNNTVGGQALIIDQGSTNPIGEYLSPVLDAGTAISWDRIAWVPNRPYGKQLVGGQLVESNYTAGNVSMMGSRILLHLNEQGTPNVFNDVSGGPVVNNATCIAANCPTPGEGIFGGALNFSAAALQYITIPHNSVMLTNQGTVSLWFKAANEPTLGQGLFSKDANGLATGGHIFISYRPTGIVRMRLQSNLVDNFVESTPGVLPNVWHHVVASFGPSGMKLYLNGALISSNVYTGGLGTTSGGTGNFEAIVLGAANVNATTLTSSAINQYLTGSLDEVVFFNRQLSNEEASSLYRRGAEELEIQVRACADATCSTNPSFVGGISEFLNTGIALPSVSLQGRVQNSRYFQYKVLMSSDRVINSPILRRVQINGTAP